MYWYNSQPLYPDDSEPSLQTYVEEFNQIVKTLEEIENDWKASAKDAPFVAHYKLGLMYSRTGRYEESINEFERVKEFNTDELCVDYIEDIIKKRLRYIESARSMLDLASND